jgi:hypothetical protein
MLRISGGAAAAAAAGSDLPKTKSVPLASSASLLVMLCVQQGDLTSVTLHDADGGFAQLRPLT